MNQDLETFIMCGTISVCSVLTSFIPKEFVLKIYGISMGLAAGALCAVLFADLFPEFIEKFVDKYKNSEDDHYYGRLFSGLFLAGVFIGGVIEATVHLFMPHDHCHGHATGHCKHGSEHDHSACVEKNVEMQVVKQEKHGHSHSHGHFHDHEHSHDHSHDGHGHTHGYAHNHHDCRAQDLEQQKEKIRVEGETPSLPIDDVENPGKMIKGEKQEDNETEEQSSTSVAEWFKQLGYIDSRVWLYTICRALHLISDGVVIGLAHEWTIVLGLLAHEIPHCLGSYGFYINYKVSRSHSIFLLISSCIGFFIGNTLVFIIKDSLEQVELYFTSIIIGMFMYVVFLIILPETMAVKDKKDALYRGLVFVFSLVSISAMIFMFHNHGDEEHHNCHNHGQGSGCQHQNHNH